MNNSTTQSGEDSLVLQQLLVEWKLKHLLPHLQAEQINLEVLQMMKWQHISSVLQGFPLGDQIRFEYHLERWRQTCGRPLTVQRGSGAAVPATTTTEAGAAAPPQQLATPTAAPTRDATWEHFVSVCSTSSQSADMLLNFDRVLGARSPPLAPPFGKYPQRRIHLRQILDTSPRANQLTVYYNRNGCLQPSQRTALINLVAMYFYENDIHLTMQMAHKLESEILELFPSEKLKDYYAGERSRIYKRVANIKHYNRKYKRNKDLAERPARVEAEQEESTRDMTDDEIRLSRDGYEHEERQQEDGPLKDRWSFVNVHTVKEELDPAVNDDDELEVGQTERRS